MTTAYRKCVICSKRPARNGMYCIECSKIMERASNHKAALVPKHFLTYRGHVVGLFPNGNGMLKSRLLKRSAGNLPKRKTLDLNTYLTGFSRDTVKSFKACVLSLVRV